MRMRLIVMTAVSGLRQKKLVRVPRRDIQGSGKGQCKPLDFETTAMYCFVGFRGLKFDVKYWPYAPMNLPGPASMTLPALSKANKNVVTH